MAVLPGYTGPEAYVRFLERARAGYPRLREARALVDSAPGDPCAIYELADAYRLLEHTHRAEELFGRVNSLSESVAESSAALRELAARCHERLARLLVMRGRSRDARGHLEAFRGLDPDARLGRADAARLTEALACANEMKFADAVRLLAGVPADQTAEDADHALYAAGVIGHETGDCATALEKLERMVRDHPRSSLRERAEERIGHIRNPPPGHEH